MTDEKKPESSRLPTKTEEAPSAPSRRTALPAAPPERRTTEIDKQRVPMAAKPYRLLALVKQDAVVRVQKEPDDTVMTWPHLLSIEFFAAAVMSVFLLLMGVFVNAPLEELANPHGDAGRGQGAVVPGRHPGAARLLPPHGRRRASRS